MLTQCHPLPTGAELGAGADWSHMFVCIKFTGKIQLLEERVLYGTLKGSLAWFIFGTSQGYT